MQDYLIPSRLQGREAHWSQRVKHFKFIQRWYTSENDTAETQETTF